VVDAGDEVIFISPPWFFYEAMILGVGGTTIKVRLSPPATSIWRGFSRNHGAHAGGAAHTPHNRTGRIFSVDGPERVGELLERACERHGRPIYIVSDEAYSRSLFDGNIVGSPAAFIHAPSGTAYGLSIPQSIGHQKMCRRRLSTTR
jgi:aspartate aminotransferase